MKERNQALLLYIILTGIFISCLISCNLIFLKFFSLEIKFLNITFTQSVGLIAYPITFLITDIVSEIYGRKKANFLVLSGIFSSIIVLGLIFLADYLPAASFSNPENKKVNDEIFHLVFGQFGIAMAASLFTYLVCQLVDIRIFHFWKKLTHGKHLWLRNNFSTITSQLVDTFLILFLLMTLSPEKGLENWSDLKILFINGFLFKILVALIDTIPLYICVKHLRNKFNLKMGEEINL
ncbi:MAG: hypothetical protein CMP68_04265 [Flavobacteriales bacterium]|nr:hypothetical protein [Flavobacteriales bacterium]|tara:strand:- start:5195 stop:5905 length:711 start_codon:yes stop_codon:yes gene_type:complete